MLNALQNIKMLSQNVAKAIFDSFWKITFKYFQGRLEEGCLQGQLLIELSLQPKLIVTKKLSYELKNTKNNGFRMA